MLAVQAVGFRLFVKPDPVEDVSDGGIVIVQDEKLARAGTQTGVLVSIGDQCWEAHGPNYTGKPWAKVGDRVLYSKYAAKFFEHPETGELLGLLNDDDVIGILKEVNEEENVDE